MCNRFLVKSPVLKVGPLFFCGAGLNTREEDGEREREREILVKTIRKTFCVLHLIVLIYYLLCVSIRLCVQKKVNVLYCPPQAFSSLHRPLLVSFYAFFVHWSVKGVKESIKKIPL